MRLKYIYYILLNLLKCLAILIILGMVLPKVIDNILVYFFNKNAHNGSILVYYIINKNFIIVYNFMYVFKEYFLS